MNNAAILTINAIISLTAAILLLLSGITQASATSAGNDFVVLPGDILQITVWKEDGMDREVVVLPNGSITFPLIGSLQVQDLTPLAIEEEIKSKLESYIPEASVAVSVKAPLGHKVSVLGQVQKPGEIILSGRTNVLQALSQVGGFTPYADEGSIVVIRTAKNGEKKSFRYPYNDLIRGKNFDKDINLEPGDVILVPTAGLF